MRLSPHTEIIPTMSMYSFNMRGKATAEAPSFSIHNLKFFNLTHVLLNPDIYVFKNIVDPDQLASLVVAS